MKKDAVAAIIVLYNPNWDLLSRVINASSLQCDKIIAIDNSPQNNVDKFDSLFKNLKNVSYLALLNNYGIAYAQNRGLEIVKNEDYEFVVFFDQDSEPETGMIQVLKEDIKFLQSNSYKVATIGPLPSNSQTNEIYQPRIFKNKKINIGSKDFYKTKQIISSGGLMSVSVFDKVGGFSEELFIDGVDHEWCWRAKKYGLDTYLSTRTKLIHNLGEGDEKLLGIHIATTSPFRLYYQYRNYIILVFRSYVPLYWKLNNLIKYSVKLVYYPIKHKDLKIVKNIFRGINDGFKMLRKK